MSVIYFIFFVILAFEYANKGKRLTRRALHANISLPPTADPSKCVSVSHPDGNNREEKENGSSFIIYFF